MHALPGRIRIEVPWVKRKPEKARELEIFLTLKDESVKASVNHRTARCLLLFNEQRISAHEIIKSIWTFMDKKVSARQKNNLTDHSPKPNAQFSKNEPEDRLLAQQFQQVLTGGAVLTLFWSLPPRGPVLPSGLGPVASAALVTTGLPFIKSGLRSLKYRRKINYDLIVSLISLVSALTGQGYIGLTTLWLANLSNLAQKYALLKSANAFSNALINKGSRIHIIRHNKFIPVLPGDVAPGDEAYFKSGDCVPVDGEVISGYASVIPGEDVVPGNTIESGTRIEQGSIIVKVDRVVEDTSLARLADILEDAVTEPETGNDLAVSFAERMLPFTILTTLGVWVFTGDLRQAVSVLLAGAPGPAGLAAPTAVSAAVSAAAGLGIAVKEAKALEDLSHVDVVVFSSHEGTDRYSGRGHLALKRLEEEGYKVETFDVNTINIGETSSDGMIEQEISREKAFIKKMQKNGLKVAWVSGPHHPVVIERADVNIMLLTGKEETVYPAEILCYGDDPRQVYRAINISRKTLHTVRHNVYLVQGINITGQVLGALGMVRGMPAVVVNLAGVLAVVLNSARALFWSGSAVGRIKTGGTVKGLTAKRKSCLFARVEKQVKPKIQDSRLI